MREALSTERLLKVYRSVAKRYDLQHRFLTANSDHRGRKLLVKKTVVAGDSVLDCGAGTGSTGLMAAQKVGADGKVVLFDLSSDMLAVAEKKAAEMGMQDRVEFETGDMANLPFEENSFDVVLSTYSLCPLYDPAKGALELYRVVRPGGRIGIAHSTEPAHPFVRRIADLVEGVVWRIPALSMGCRAIHLLPELEHAGGKVVFKKSIGVPLWPFMVFVVEKAIA